jgi:hypothetical protein
MCRGERQIDAFPMPICSVSVILRRIGIAGALLPDEIGVKKR